MRTLKHEMLTLFSSQQCHSVFCLMFEMFDTSFKPRAQQFQPLKMVRHTLGPRQTCARNRFCAARQQWHFLWQGHFGSTEWRICKDIDLSIFLSPIYVSIHPSTYVKNTSYIGVNFYGAWDWKTPKISMFHILVLRLLIIWQSFRHVLVVVWSICHCLFFGQG